MREKRERLLEIKKRLAEPGSTFGVNGVCRFGIINTGHSYNSYSTLPYDELRRIQKKENKFRKTLGLKPNRKPINNLQSGYKPEIDPRILRAGLKQKRAYYGGGELNMNKIEATGVQLQRVEEKLEKIGKKDKKGEKAGLQKQLQELEVKAEKEN